MGNSTKAVACSRNQSPNRRRLQEGQTTDQAQASLGKPEKIVRLGAKQIYVYKDLKVTFQNGKVVDE